MTISKKDILANRTLAIDLIGHTCSNAAIGEQYEKALPSFQSILPTTWTALADDGYLRFTSHWHFELTPSGWIAALDAIGTLCSEQMKKDLGSLAGKLKDRLKRTEGPALVGTHEIVTETGLPHYWVVNAIHSHLIKHCQNRKDADWAPEDNGSETVIEVPIDFGHPL